MPDPQPNPNPGNPGGGNPPAEPSAVDWKAHIPADMATEKFWEPLKDKPLGDVLKGYGEAQRKFGTAVWVPKEDAPPETWAKFYQKLGTPEAPDKYQFTRPALGEGAAWDKEFENKFLSEAHAMGLNSKQVQKLMDLQAGLVETQLRGLAEKRNGTVEALKKEWGGDFERRMTLAGRAKNLIQEKTGLTKEEADQFFDGTGAGDHPVILKIFNWLGEMFAEDGWIKGEGTATARDAAKAKIDQITKDPKHPYWNEGPGHKEAVQEWLALHKQAFG